MNEWDQRIREHRVWAEMSNLGPMIDAALAVKGLSPETIAGLERIRAILSYCGKRIAAAEPLITAPQPLESVAISLATVQGELTAFVSDKNPTHVSNANIAADAALLPLAQIPGAYSPEELGALVATATAYRETVLKALAEATEKLDALESLSDVKFSTFNRQIEESFNGLTSTANSLQASLAQVTAAVQTEQQKLTQIASDQQGQFSVSQEARGKEFTESLRASTQELAKLVTDYQGQFSTGQEARSKEFVLSESARQTKYNEAVSEYGKRLAEQDAEFTKERSEFVAASKENLERLTAEYEEKTKQILNTIEERKGDVEKLVGVIGNLGVTSGYLRTANQAQRAMWGWQGLTVLALGSLSGLAYCTLGLLEDSKGQFVWGIFAGRVLFLASLGVLAAYSGHQADKLFIDERRNRKLALELEAIGPYLAPLPLEEQTKFRIQIGDRSFGRDHDTESHAHRKSPASLIDVLKSKESKDLLDVAIELVKKAKDTK